MNPFEYWKLRISHKLLHHNKLFYTLSPELTLATIWAVRGADPAIAAMGGGYYEFGVFKGYNLWLASKLLPDCQVHGFDSFQGMPASIGHHPHHAPGGYSASIEEVRNHLAMHGADFERIHLHKGWFSDKFFRGLWADYSLPPVLIAAIDSDLYKSCVPVLEFLRPLLHRGSILLFDDWKMPAPSERDALHEFLADSDGFKVELWFSFGVYGQAIRVMEVQDG